MPIEITQYSYQHGERRGRVEAAELRSNLAFRANPFQPACRFRLPCSVQDEALAFEGLDICP